MKTKNQLGRFQLRLCGVERSEERTRLKKKNRNNYQENKKIIIIDKKIVMTISLRKRKIKENRPLPVAIAQHQDDQKKYKQVRGKNK